MSQADRLRIRRPLAIVYPTALSVFRDYPRAVSARQGSGRGADGKISLDRPRLTWQIG